MCFFKGNVKKNILKLVGFFEKKMVKSHYKKKKMFYIAWKIQEKGWKKKFLKKFKKKVEN